MIAYPTTYRSQLNQEIAATPSEYLPMLLDIIRAFRQSITLQPAATSFRQGWREAISGEVLPVDDLWTGIEPQADETC